MVPQRPVTEVAIVRLGCVEPVVDLDVILGDPAEFPG